MPLTSMTGFASLSCEIALSNKKVVHCLLELKTLNSRFFDGSCKIPSSLASLETDILALLNKMLIRGRVFFSLTFDEHATHFDSIEPSFSALDSYVKAVAVIQKKYDLAGNLTVSDILSLPNVFVVRKESFSEKIKKDIMSKLEDLAILLTRQRVLEGGRLAKDLKGRFAFCSKSIKRIEKFAVELMKTQKKNLDSLLESIAAGDDASKQKSLELQSLLNKIDINEEITRFRSHLHASDNLLTSKEVEKGKKLDFILQELLRETNTIAAKCSHFGISSSAVDIKVELEKIREQAQNIL